MQLPPHLQSRGFSHLWLGVATESLGTSAVYPTSTLSKSSTLNSESSRGVEDEAVRWARAEWQSGHGNLKGALGI
jgi:hypothetical protein